MDKKSRADMMRRWYWWSYRVRTCYSLHHCEVCDGEITHLQKYYDGGCDRRAHVDCVARMENG